MDPLSITAADEALIHASTMVTTSLRRLNGALRTAESRIADLCNELPNLTASLKAVEVALKGCSSLNVASMDGALWRQSEIVMSDCRATLSELGLLVDQISESTDSRGRGWRARVAMDMNVHRRLCTGLWHRLLPTTCVSCCSRDARMSLAPAFGPCRGMKRCAFDADRHVRRAASHPCRPS